MSVGAGEERLQGGGGGAGWVRGAWQLSCLDVSEENIDQLFSIHLLAACTGGVSFGGVV